jgi:hypothetical protein
MKKIFFGLLTLGSISAYAGSTHCSVLSRHGDMIIGEYTANIRSGVVGSTSGYQMFEGSDSLWSYLRYSTIKNPEEPVIHINIYDKNGETVLDKKIVTMNEELELLNVNDKSILINCSTH